MANGLAARARTAVFGALLAGLTAAPGQAQFMSPGSYPVIVVPPPAQNMVMPRRPKLPPAPPNPTQSPPDATGPRQLACHYQGQTRVCE